MCTNKIDMPTYPPRNNPTRKAEILNQKIFEFLRHLDTKGVGERLVNKAERVKIAKLNLLKARLTLLKSYKAEDQNESDSELRKKLELEMTKWESITQEEIKDYCEKVSRI